MTCATLTLLAWTPLACSASDVSDTAPSATATSQIRFSGSRPKSLATKPPSGKAAAAEPISIQTKRFLPLTAAAHQALQQGDLTTARAMYSTILASDPDNLHALTALALLAAQDGQIEQASAFLRKAESLAPRDGAVLAAAAMIRPNPIPTQMESRLQNALAEQPDALGLHFVLGNVYASQQRWSDAQNAYFHAVAGDGGNPDFLFNLAISLDHLGHSRLALNYYRQASAAAEHRPASFDPHRLKERVDRLAGSVQ